MYSNVFPEIYYSTEKRGFDLKSNFHITFKTYKAKKIGNYETIRNEANIYKQKSVNVDDFNEVKEKEVKERIEKRKQKRCEVTEKNKLLKQKEN